MAYSELIKNFDKIREYIRQFYVYGFRTRTNFGLNSMRSYDNEHRRVDSWLCEYMQFRHNEDGKVSFLSIDSRQIPRNPLYKAFKTKSFTDNDIIFHFCILDLLNNENKYSATEILDLINSEYLCHLENDFCIDDSTIRRKLKEYVKTGLLKEQKQGKEILYSRHESNLDLENWIYATDFFTEFSPVGVIGSYISDRQEAHDSPFRFKHSYMFQAIDSQILYNLLLAINEKRDIKPIVKTKSADFPEDSTVHPLKIYQSTQNGRQYLLCYHIELDRIIFIRLDNIVSVDITDINSNHSDYLKKAEEIKPNLWGVVIKDKGSVDTVKMTVHMEDNEEYVYNRMLREKRCGNVTRVDKNTCVFTAEVFDALELLPWIRTFIGRIENFYCTNTDVTNRLHSDIKTLNEFYGGDSNAVL